MVFRCFWNRRLCVLSCLLNMWSALAFALMCISMFLSLLEILKIRGLLPFSGVTRTVLVSKSMSVQRILLASPDRMAVSFNSRRKVAVFLPHPAISVLSSFSVGMNGIFDETLHFGFSHVSPSILRKRL